MKSKTIQILTPFQVRILRALGKEPLLKDFYLTGGTALSAFYLRHRYSEDLDFFTAAPGAVARVPALIRQFAKKNALRLVLGRRFQTLFECALAGKRSQRLEMDFALDMPGRLAPVKAFVPGTRVRLDNSLDMACNKLSALLERVEPKDFVDVYYIDRELLPLKKLILKAREKYPELDSYSLAMAFFKVKSVSILPRMVKPLTLDSLREFFLSHATRLTRSLTR